MPDPIKHIEGLTTRISSFDQAETKRRLIEAIIEQGMRIVAEIDHASAACLVGLHLRPTSVFIFGNAVVGTPLIQIAPTIAIDLPLRMLVWTDEDGVSWLAYIDPFWLADRHTAEAGTGPVLDRMRRSLTIVADHATGAAFRD